jgi:S-disulfanyl-L-cysteine oxidoreductase SoxD
MASAHKFLAASAVTTLAIAVGIAGCASTGGGGKTSIGIPMGSTGPHPVQPLPDKPRFGQPVSEADLAAWNIDIRAPDGAGLPAGSGTVAQGAKIYQAKCLACHGPDAKGGTVYGTMVGGIGSFKGSPRILTPGSMYPYAPILFDYIRRAMPMDAPQSLTANETYALSAYLLNLNGLLPADASVDQKSLPQIKMPNRDGFLVDDRPDSAAVRCMTNCK